MGLDICHWLKENLWAPSIPVYTRGEVLRYGVDYCFLTSCMNWMMPFLSGMTEFGIHILIHLF